MKKLITIYERDVLFTKKNSKWTFEFRVMVNGTKKRIRKSAKTSILEQAVDRASIELGRHLKNDIDPNHNPNLPAEIVFQQYYNRLKNNGRAQSTLLNIERFQIRFIEYFGKKKSLNAVLENDVENWKHWLAKQDALTSAGKPSGRKLSIKTIREHLSWLSSVYQKSGSLTNPVANVERPKKTHTMEVEEMKFYTPAEIKKAMAAAKEKIEQTEGNKNQSNWIQFELALRVFVYTGARYSEIMFLRKKDLNHSLKQVHFWKNKNRKSRVVSLDGDLIVAWNALVELEERAKAELGEEYGDESRVIPKHKLWFSQMHVRLCDEFGLIWKGNHAYRHSYASIALSLNNERLEDVAKHLGHSYTECDKTYSHFIKGKEKRFKF